MRHHSIDRSPLQQTYQPMNNHHRPDFRFPPLRLKHLAVPESLRDSLASSRLLEAGYSYDSRLDLWTKPGEEACCIRRGYVLKLTKATQRHLSVRKAP